MRLPQFADTLVLCEVQAAAIIWPDQDYLSDEASLIAENQSPCLVTPSLPKETDVLINSLSRIEHSGVPDLLL